MLITAAATLGRSGHRNETHARDMRERFSGRVAYIALGSNAAGAWGTPVETLASAIRRLSTIGLHVKVVSENFMTGPVGGPWQSDFVNAVVCARMTAAPATVLRGLKRLEREAGRRPGPLWGPRTLDLDLIDAGVVIGWHRRGRRRAGELRLPHPLMHRRAFVLIPLAEVASHWRHPILARSVGALLQDRAVRLQCHGVRRIAPVFGAL
jgi:2-amino-4-hydroxy-6-hydroxymethyldihydropteridine diphosphokinase